MHFCEIQGHLNFFSIVFIKLHIFEKINLVDNLNFSAFCSSLAITTVPFHRIRNRNFPKIAKHVLLRTRAKSQKALSGVSTSCVNLSIAASINCERDSWKFRSLWRG